MICFSLLENKHNQSQTNTLTISGQKYWNFHPFVQNKWSSAPVDFCRDSIKHPVNPNEPSDHQNYCKIPWSSISGSGLYEEHVSALYRGASVSLQTSAEAAVWFEEPLLQHSPLMPSYSNKLHRSRTKSQIISELFFIRIRRGFVSGYI